jgi:hypothetical protein
MVTRKCRANDHVIILVEYILWQKPFYISYMNVYGLGTSKGVRGGELR